MALPKSVCITMLVVHMTEIVLIVMLNFFTILVFTKSRFLRRRSLYLVLNLAIVDMLVGGLSETNIFLKIGNLCPIWKVPVSRIGCLHLLFVIASMTNLVAISVERMHATFRPLRHRFIKKRTYSVIITAIWATAATLTTAIVFTDRYHTKSSLMYYYYELNSFNAISLLVICACYASIAIKVYRGSHLLHHGAVTREKKLTKTLFIVTIVSLLMWLPFTIGSFLKFSTDILASLPKIRRLWFNFVCIVLFYGNSLVNPTLYAIRQPDFRRAMISLFRPKRQRRVPPVLDQNVMHRV